MAKRRIIVEAETTEENKEQSLMEQLVSEAKKIAEAEIAEERSQLEKEIADKRAQLENEILSRRQELEKEVYDKTTQAQKDADNLLKEARRQSRTIVATAENEARKIRDSAQQEQDKVNIEIEEQRQSLEKKREEILDEAQRKINEANIIIKSLNLIQSRNSATIEKNSILEKLLSGYRMVLEKTLGRPVSQEEIETFMTNKSNEKVEKTDYQKVIDDPDFIKTIGRIQPINLANNGKSIFEYTEDGNMNKFGQIILEKSDSDQDFKFNDRAIFNVVSLALLSKSDKFQVCRDGLLISQSPHNSIVGARTIVKSGENYYNVINLFSSSKVIPIHDFLTLSNFILLLDGGEVKPKNNARGCSINCLTYSEREHHDTKNCRFISEGDGLYHITLKTKDYDNYHDLGYGVYFALNCSAKGISKEQIDIENDNAFILNNKLGKYGDKFNWIKKINLTKMTNDISIDSGRE